MKRALGITVVGVIGVALLWWGVQLVRGPDGSIPLPLPVASTVKEERLAPPPPPPKPAGAEIYAYEPEGSVPFPPGLELQSRAASAGLLVDVTGKRILWGKRENELVPIASMTKMMTLLVVIREMENNPQLTLDTHIKASRAAASMGGTQIWLETGEVATLRELLVALMVQSANDAAYAIGEGTNPAGEIERFIASMNRTARDIGMRHARYYNPHGLPGPRMSEENRASCMDQAVLALELQNYPLAMELAGTKTASFLRPGREPLHMKNHNKLVFTLDGVTGMKTGFNSRAGFCLTATAERQGQRFIAVATGFNSQEQRNAFVTALLEWGFSITGAAPSPAAGSATVPASR